MRPAAILLLLPLAGLPARAALEWKTTDQHVEAAIGQQQAVLVYAFRNAGSRPVRILALDPSCSCLEAEPDREVYAPGEAGEIRVDLALTGYVGRLRRSVAVQTDDPDHRYTELTLTVDIPEPVAITPRFLFWTTGESPDEKSLAIVTADPKTTTIGAVECDNPIFTVRLVAGAPGHLHLQVKPAATREPTEATVRLHTVIAGRDQVYIIYLAVKSPAPPS